MDGLSILLLRFAQRRVVKPRPYVVPSGESQMGSRHITWPDTHQSLSSLFIVISYIVVSWNFSFFLLLFPVDQQQIYRYSYLDTEKILAPVSSRM